MKRLIAVCLISALLCCLPLQASAEGPGMEDIRGHWAREAIEYCLSQGLYSGVSETRFDPDGAMTRGMFVTVLGRLAGAAPRMDRYWYVPRLFSDVEEGAYYAPYVGWAVELGVTNGVSPGVFAPNEPVTREQMAAMIARWCELRGFALFPAEGAAPVTFADGAEIAPYAREAVELMRTAGLVNGIANGEGELCFEPRGLLTRAQCAAIVQRLSGSLTLLLGWEPNLPQYMLFENADTLSGIVLTPGEEETVRYTVYPEGAESAVLWFSLDPAVVTVRDGVLTARALGETEVYALARGGLCQGVAVAVVDPDQVPPQAPEEEEPEEPGNPEPDAPEDPILGEPTVYVPQSYEDKCILVFGEVVEDPREVLFGGEGYLEEVTVGVWDFRDESRTEKITREFSIRVNQKIAYLVEAAFEELYNSPSRFPISALGGYYEGGRSEHTPGLAFDVNPWSNYMVRADGTVVSGDHFDPENDPYSIPLGGEVDQIFEKYGFIRGVWWPSSKDYMHYSFFGT